MNRVREDDPIDPKTQRELFSSLKEYLGITTWEHRIRFARENSVKIHSYRELTEGQAKKLLFAIENAGPIDGLYYSE